MINVRLGLLRREIDYDETLDTRICMVVESGDHISTVTVERGCAVIRTSKNRIQHFQWLYGENESIDYKKACIMAQCVAGHTLNIYKKDEFDRSELLKLSALSEILIALYSMECRKDPNYDELIRRCTDDMTGTSVLVQFDDDVSWPPKQIVERIRFHSGFFSKDQINYMHENHLLDENEIVIPISTKHYMDIDAFNGKPFTMLI